MEEAVNAHSNPNVGRVDHGEIEKTAEHLHKVEADLEAFIESTEEDFLDVGNALRQYYSRATQLSRNANAVVNLMMGDEIIATVEGLEGLLDQLNVYTRILDQESSATEKGLREARRRLAAFSAPVSSRVPDMGCDFQATPSTTPASKSVTPMAARSIRK